MKLIIRFVWGLGLLLSNAALCQNSDPSSKEAKDNFNLGNYQSALQEYLELLKSEPNDPKYNYRVGYCYTHTYIDRSKAIKYLEIAAKDKGYEEEATFELAKCYQYLYEFDKAIELFKKYKVISKDRPQSDMRIADREIEICNYAKELIKLPVKATFENLGKRVNSEYADYYPFVIGDETELFFTTRRKGTTGGFMISNDLYTSDIVLSKNRGGSWSKPRSAGHAFNSPGEDEATGITQDGKYVIIYTETEMEVGDLFVAIQSGRSYKERIPLESGVNTEKIEAAGSVTPDGNTIVFSSDRGGSFGELDIYMAKRLPTGTWGEPFSLGPNINTEYIEDFPQISADGKTLYFCSQGHINMGGFDIFKSTYNESTREWSKAVNIGYPLNTPDDNMTISFTEDGKYAYLSAFREGGEGDLDIYRVKFDEEEPRYTVVRGSIETEEAEDLSIKFNVYQRDSVIKEFPAEIKPNNEWTFIKSIKKDPVPGIEVIYAITCIKNGKKLFITLDKFPKDDPTIEVLDIKEIKKPVSGGSPPSEPKMIVVPVTPDDITLTNKITGELYGNYKTVGNSGNYIIIAPPGTYDLTIEKEGYETFTEVLIVNDLGTAQKEISKPIMLKKL